MFLESGGDHAASFSPELVDASIYVIDVSGGDKIPRKGGPGVTRSDLLVINKIDLADRVGASLEVMDRDSRLMRGSPAVRFYQPQGPHRPRRGDLVDSARRALRNRNRVKRVRLRAPECSATSDEFRPRDCIHHPNQSDSPTRSLHHTTPNPTTQPTRPASDIGRVARLELVFACRGGRTVLAHAYAEPPFRVGRLLHVGPRRPKMILVCSGPGVFAGDRLEQRVRVERGARVLLVSQAALQVHPAAAASPGVNRWRPYEIEDEADRSTASGIRSFHSRPRAWNNGSACESPGAAGCSGAMRLMSGRTGHGESWQFEEIGHELRLHRSTAR